MPGFPGAGLGRFGHVPQPRQPRLAKLSVDVFARCVTPKGSPTPPRRGVFPGSFNPLTVAHLAVIEQARRDYELDTVELVVSEVALDKGSPPGPPIADRIALISADIADYRWISVRTTRHQLIADIAQGYDAVVMGADKWEQVNDARYYGSEAERDDALRRLPQVIVAERSGFSAPDDLCMKTDPALHDVSSTRARAGDRSIMAPHAARDYRL